MKILQGFFMEGFLFMVPAFLAFLVTLIIQKDFERAGIVGGCWPAMIFLISAVLYPFFIHQDNNVAFYGTLFAILVHIAFIIYMNIAWIKAKRKGKT